jgi:hypothetical protein
MLARSGFLHVENVFSPTTQASGFAAGPEFTPDVSSLAFLSGAIERVIGIGSKPERLAGSVKGILAADLI